MTEIQSLIQQQTDAMAQELSSKTEPTAPVQQPQVEPTVTPNPVIEPAPITPTEDRIGNVLRTDFEEAFKAYTNGKGLDTLKELEEVNSLRQKITEFETQSKVSPFVNPIVEKLNQMYAANADAKTISMFLEAQTMDIDNMSERERFAQSLVRQYPSYNIDKARSLYDRKYGEDAELDDEQELEKIRELDKATQYLKAQKLAAENPEHIRLAAQQKEQQERFKAQWQEQLRGIAPNVKGFTGQYKDQNQELSYNIALSSQEVENVLPYVLNEMSNAGMELNQQNLALAQDLIMKYAFVANPQKYFETVHRDAYAKGFEAATKKVAGNVAIPNEAGGVAEPKTQADLFLEANSRFMSL